jgi:hypothetical protein
MWLGRMQDLPPSGKPEVDVMIVISSTPVPDLKNRSTTFKNSLMRSKDVRL